MIEYEYVVFVRMRTYGGSALTAQVMAATPKNAINATLDKMTVKEVREITEIRIIEIAEMREWEPQ